MAARPIDSVSLNFHYCAWAGLTIVERSQLVASDFGIVHPLEQWLNASIIFAPKIICNYWYKQGTLSSQSDIHSHDKETVGPSAMVPGIPPDFHDKELASAVCKSLGNCVCGLYDVRYDKMWVGSYQLYSS